MRGWIFDVELDLQRNQKIEYKQSERIWYLSYLIILAITLVYIILYSSNKSSEALEQKQMIFFIVIYVLAGFLILFSIGVAIYYIKQLQKVQIETVNNQRSVFQRHSIVRGSHFSGGYQNKLNRQGTGKINNQGKFKQDSNQSIEEIKNTGNNNINAQKSSSYIGSPKANKEAKKSDLSSQNSLQLQSQQQPQQGIQGQGKKGVQLGRGKTQFLDQGKVKESNKLGNSIIGGQSGIGGIMHITEESNILHVQQQQNLNRRQFQLKYLFSTEILCSLGWIAVVSHIGCIYCFFSRSPYWNTTQIWNGVCLFALFPTHMLSIIIFANANINLLIDRSLFIKSIQSNYLLTIYKNAISQIGYISMILLIISLIWGSIVQIVKNKLDIPAIVLLALIGFAFATIFVIRKTNYFCNQFKKGYRFLVEQINR